MDKLFKLLEPLYKDQTGRVVENLTAYINNLPKCRYSDTDKYWYKNLNLYMVYPDGVNYDPGKPPVQNLIPHLEHIKDLGCIAMHILPFLDSPMIDKGYDIKDFYRIRPGLGSLDDLKSVIKKAEENKIRLFMDLVFNHVSDEHEWFRKAIEGDTFYRDFFLWTDKKPDFLQIIEKSNAKWAQYNVEGETKTVRIEFPQHAGPIPHWEMRIDNNWYYHSYYPQQIDLNWLNPNVFIEASKILLFWAQLGFSFRFDAALFIGKPAYKQVDGGNENTHIVLAGLKNLAGQINPGCAFLVESYESIETIIGYFGTSNRGIADLDYNFHLCANSWVSIVLKNPDFIWDTIGKLTKLPNHGEWINFLRNHDELGLRYLDDNVAAESKSILMNGGVPFGTDIAGRTFSLLGENKNRFVMAYLLLSSLPGGMLVPYGDEIAWKNIPVNELNESDKNDARNVNRGTIPGGDFKNNNQDVLRIIRQIITNRKILNGYRNILPVKTSYHGNVFSGKYILGSSELHFIINLTPDPVEITFNTQGFETLIQVNDSEINSTTIKLGPYAGLWLQK